MTPYYSDDLIAVYNADFRDVLASFTPGHFDLSVADPPYGINETAKASKGSRDSLAKSMVWAGPDYDAERWTPDHIGALLLAAENTVIWGGNYYTDMLPASPCWLVWDKDNTGAFADCEMAWCSHKSAARLFKWRWNGMLQEDMARKEARVYPGQKPVPLMRWVLTMFSKPGDVIFDPCSGSGPVAQACKELGCHCVACDVSELACELTAKRCRQEVMGI